MYIILGISVFVAFLVFKFYYRPKLAYRHYQKRLKELGYRVLTLPYNPLSAPIFDLYAQNEHSHQDPLYESKHSFKNYDIIVTNFLSYPFLIFTNLKIAK